MAFWEKHPEAQLHLHCGIQHLVFIELAIATNIAYRSHHFVAGLGW